MSFYQLLALFDDRRQLFGGVLLAAVVMAAGTYFIQPSRYTNELWLTVTRTQVASSPDYTYDHFYRFQADERLAESLTVFLQGEVGKRMIAEKAKLDDGMYQQFLKTKLGITKQGTNEIKVVYQTKTLDQGAQLGEAMLTSANAYLFALNEDANQKEWFTVVGAKPAAWDARWSFGRLLLVGFVSGLVVAFWSAVLHFFWGEYRMWRARR